MARPPDIALLLSQVGIHVSQRFARRLEPLGLTPARVGVLRVVGQQPGLSQRALAERLGAAPSRVVALVDDLEAEGLLERRRSATDRRQQELYVVADAADRVAAARDVAREHAEEVTAGLDDDEVAQLRALLHKLAEHQGLDVGSRAGHPGYGGG